jgi:hypothetical protein
VPALVIHCPHLAALALEPLIRCLRLSAQAGR